MDHRHMMHPSMKPNYFELSPLKHDKTPHVLELVTQTHQHTPFQNILRLCKIEI